MSMKTKIYDFFIGFMSPGFIEYFTKSKYFDLNVWIDQLIFIFISVATGVLVAVLKDKILRCFKK